jgi:hypothetical protein
MGWAAREQRRWIDVLLADSGADVDAGARRTDRLPPPDDLPCPHTDGGQEPHSDSNPIGAGHNDKTGVPDGTGEADDAVGRGTHDRPGSAPDIDAEVARAIRRCWRPPRIHDRSSHRGRTNDRDGRVGRARGDRRRHRCGAGRPGHGVGCAARNARRHAGAPDQQSDAPNLQAVETPIFERSWSTARVWIWQTRLSVTPRT